MQDKIQYLNKNRNSIFNQLDIRKDPDEAFENAIKRGMKNPEDWMYMYSKNDRDYFKHCDHRTYQSFLIKKKKERER